MIRTDIQIESIPAILWGSESSKLFIAVHGNQSCKDDKVIAIFAEKAVEKGYQVLSFDLPEHGDRKNDADLCSVQNCVHDLAVVLKYAKQAATDISLFGCSMGAYFSLLAYRDVPLKQCLFLSPVLSMERIIDNMMKWFEISAERLMAEKEIETPIGQTLYWDYYRYVQDHPISKWEPPTAILYGSEDTLCEFDIVSAFAAHFGCALDILEHGEHYFHTEEHLDYYGRWLADNIQ